MKAVFVSLPSKVLANIKAKQQMPVANARIFQALATGYGRAAAAGHRRALRIIGEALEDCFDACVAGVGRELTAAMDEVSHDEKFWNFAAGVVAHSRIPSGSDPISHMDISCTTCY
jgi:hypothetical protein